MRNDNGRRASPLGDIRDSIAGDGAHLSLIHLHRQTLLSGPIDGCLALAQQAQAHSWPEIASGDSYAIRLRRDRIIVLNGPILADGWHDDFSVAVSDMTGGYVVFELSGPRVLEVLKTGTELDINLASGSAMRRFHRHEVFLYRWQEDGRFRLHIQRGYLDSMWHLLAGLVEG